MSQRLPVIMFVVGVLAGDLTFRLTEFATYRVVLVVACIAAGVLYLLSNSHELVKDAAFPLVGGIALGGIIKVVFATAFASVGGSTP
jgi:uncharacterized membrane protein YoaK (UPF0700 family)